jgi:hypothetical protein
MHHDDTQVHRMVDDLQYMQFASLERTASFVGKLLQDIRALQPIFNAYQEVRYEPLDYHYVLLKYIGALNTELVEDLCSGHYTWRGTVVASWLACLCPQPGYTAALQAAQAHTPAHNKWITELALADIQGALWPGHPRLQGAIRELRQRLNTVAHPHFVIRPALSPSELAQLQLEQQRILAAYRLGGRAAATQALTGTLASVVLCAKPAMKLAP